MMLRWFTGTIALGATALSFWHMAFLHSLYSDLGDRFVHGWWTMALSLAVVTLWTVVVEVTD